LAIFLSLVVENIQTHHFKEYTMKITEIVSEATANKWLAEAIESSDNTEEIDMEFLETNIEKWSNEFDSLQRKIKKTDKINHYDNNRIIGLYYLIPAAMAGIHSYKNLVAGEIPLNMDSAEDKLFIDTWCSPNLLDEDDDYFPDPS
jgi:hypothetical protein